MAADRDTWCWDRRSRADHRGSRARSLQASTSLSAAISARCRCGGHRRGRCAESRGGTRADVELAGRRSISATVATRRQRSQDRQAPSDRRLRDRHRAAATSTAASDRPHATTTRRGVASPTVTLRRLPAESSACADVPLATARDRAEREYGAARARRSRVRSSLTSTHATAVHGCDAATNCSRAELASGRRQPHRARGRPDCRQATMQRHDASRRWCASGSDADSALVVTARDADRGSAERVSAGSPRSVASLPDASAASGETLRRSSALGEPRLRGARRRAGFEFMIASTRRTGSVRERHRRSRID